MTEKSVALEMIAVEKLKPHPKNPRLIMRREVVDGIKAAILERGEFSPKYAILARPVDDYYEIISGHHRFEAAKAANCESIPCWIESMDAQRAEMELVLANNQGELTPLEYGLHALHCVPIGKVGAGRGNKEGLSEYAEAVNRNRTQLIEWRKAAFVFETVKNCQKENCQKIDSFNSNNFIDKHSFLSAIHSAPAESWPALCQFLLEGKDVTVAKIQGKAKELADLKKAIPDWWPMDFALLAVSALADPMYVQRMIRVFQFASEQDSAFRPVVLYRHERTEEQEVKNGRAYFKMNPVAYDYDAPSEFKARILNHGAIPKIDQLREISHSIELHIRVFAESGIRWLPVLTDEEQAEAEERHRLEVRQQEQKKAVAGLIHDDCVSGLRSYIGSKFDLLLTDPPYGMAFQSNRRTAKEKDQGIDGDDSIESALKLFDAAISSALPHLADDAHVIVFCCDDYEPDFRTLLASKGLTFKRLLVWVKPNHTSGDLEGGFAPRKELALHFVKGSPSLSPRIDDVFIQDAGESVTSHPTEKPLSLLKAWMQSTTRSGDWVLDPFMGTGASLVAAKQLGRRYIGFEIKSDWYERAVDRVLAEVQ